MRKTTIFLISFIFAGTLFSQTWDVPELIYYRMHTNTPSTTKNFASSPVGTNPAPYSGEIMNSGGEFDTCIQGSGSNGTNGILPNWNCSLGNGNWTISFWVKDLAEVVANNPVYLFGDPGSASFRCFYGGFATVNNCILRGPFPDLLIACPMPGNFVFHIVYNGSTISIYQNGVFISSIAASITFPTGTGFRVAGYTGGTNSLNSTGKMDEFRLYNRALNQAEITATWNHELPLLVGISHNSNNIPLNYELNQNFPNPFNPTTVISYSIPKASFVNLTVSDILGRTSVSLINTYQQPGNYEFNFDATNFASGTYIYKIEANGFIDIKKMILIK